MKFALLSLSLLLSISNVHAETSSAPSATPAFVNPKASPVPAVNVGDSFVAPPAAVTAEPSVSPTPEPKFFGRIEYAHSFGNSNNSGGENDLIGFESAAHGRLTLDFGSNDDNPIYLGLGYLWMGDLYQNGVKLEQSRHQGFFELGSELSLFKVATVQPRVGFSVQYYPSFFHGSADPSEIQFQYGFGCKIYASLHFLKDYSLSVGWDALAHAYKEGPGNEDQDDFFLRQHSFYFAISTGF